MPPHDQTRASPQERAARRTPARVRGAPPGDAAGAPSRSFGPAYRVREEIHAHPQRRLMKLRGVMVDIGILPPVPEIGLIGVVYDKAVSQKNAEPLRGQPVVLVDLGNPLGEGVHQVVNRVYAFPKGIPKIHEHDGLPAQGFGIFLGDRLVVYYSYQSDLGDGWEDPDVHHDPPELHEAALRMGVNLFTYAVSGTK